MAKTDKMSADKKKVAIIGTVGVPACYGGFETLAEHLITHTAKDHDITVYCSTKKYPKQDRLASYKGATLKYLPFDANGVQSIIYDSVSIIHAAFKSDLLLVLGVAGAWLFPLIRLFTNKKIVVSIDGIEWKRDKWNRLAQWYLWWAESIAVRYSHVDISDNESIQDYTAQRYGTLSNIIEYGADHVLSVPPTPEDKKNYPFLAKSYAFKVCRIEPENNVHVVLEAFSELPRYNFVMVGNWNVSDYGVALKEKYSGFENIHLLDPIYDQRALDVLRSNALIYIHGHSAGGTNPSLVEAMYLKLPIVAYNVSYNRTTTEQKALYFNDKESLKTLIQNTKVKELKDIANTMKSIADTRYTWKVVADKYNFLVRKAFAITTKVGIKGSLANRSKRRLAKQGLSHLKNQTYFYQKS